GRPPRGGGVLSPPPPARPPRGAPRPRRHRGPPAGRDPAAPPGRRRRHDPGQHRRPPADCPRRPDLERRPAPPAAADPVRHRRWPYPGPRPAPGHHTVPCTSCTCTIHCLGISTPHDRPLTVTLGPADPPGLPPPPAHPPRRYAGPAAGHNPPGGRELLDAKQPTDRRGARIR